MLFDVLLLLHLNMVVIPVKHRCGRTKALTDVTSPNEQPERTVDRRAAPRRAAPPLHADRGRVFAYRRKLFIHSWSIEPRGRQPRTTYIGDVS